MSEIKKQLLKGIKVVDFSRILVGSFTSMLLADLGAEVIKIESINGDETRSWGPPFIDQSYSTYYTSLNRNKKSITLDFKAPHASSITSRLVKDADIFIENFPYNKLTKFNLDYDSVKKINDNVIYASVNGFGYEGELKASPAFDFIIQAYSGIMGITGKDTPYRVGFPVCDILTSQQLYSAIMTALLYKEKFGEGQLIQTSLLEASVFANPTIVSAFLNGDKNSKLIGNDHPSISPYTVFEIVDHCENIDDKEKKEVIRKIIKETNMSNNTSLRDNDSFEDFVYTKIGRDNISSIAIGVALDSQFDHLLEALNIKKKIDNSNTNKNADIKTDNTILINYSDFSSNSLRVKNRKELSSILQKAFYINTINNSKEELFVKLKEFKIPFSKINSMKELFSEKQVKDIGLVRETTDHYSRGNKNINDDIDSTTKLYYPKNPINYEKISLVDFKVPPKLGEHTIPILKNLGFSDSDIKEFRLTKTIL